MSILNRERTEQVKQGSITLLIDRLASAPELIAPPYFRWKGIIGRVVAAILLIPGLPILGLSVLLVRLTSRGPGIFRQARVGENGCLFTMYKIRTMREDAEAETGPIWPVAHDPRTTRVGRRLRSWHLDEFPQLFNVLRGEMCLIGPRPERPEFVEVLAEKIPGYLDRLAVRPGITGLAQINLPPDSDLGSVRRKLALDLEYIRHAGVWLDLRMFLWTLLRLMGLPGEYLTLLLGLSRQVPQVGYHLTGANGRQLERSLRTPAILAAASGNGRADGDGKAVTRRRTKRRKRRRATLPRKPR